MAVALFATLIVLGLYIYVAPNLPNVAQLRDMRLTTPMQVYSADGQLIAEFGDERRVPVRYEEIPPLLVNAFVAVEDQRFFEHGGVDLMGLLRIAVTNLTSSHAAGASTITMQVARNYFLTRDRTLARKFTEIFLAMRIESQFNKQEIMEMYLNKIHFSHRAYGIASAAQTYYGKTLADLSVHEMAVLAGIPKGESENNPISNPKKAEGRRNHVLKRMLAEKYIDQTQYDDAIAQSIHTTYHGPSIEFTAPYLAEMARAHVVSVYGEQRAYSDGIKVFTTAPSSLQRTANGALVRALREYDGRHGWRGAEAKFNSDDLSHRESVVAQLKRIPVLADLEAAVITQVNAQDVVALRKDGSEVTVPWDGLSWARRYINENSLAAAPKTAAEIVRVGDVVRLEQNDQQQWRLTQVPNVAGALVALNPRSGAILALVGGLDFDISQFNRVLQAKRQPGSNIKPFIYAAAFEKGMTPATLINDAPIIDEDNGEDDVWRPENDSRRYAGPTRLRVALYRSLNSITARLFNELGGEFLTDYLTRFGFDKSTMEPYPALALGGAIQVAPIEVARAYATLANGGYLVQPHFIEKITDGSGATLYEQKPVKFCRACAVGETTPNGSLSPVLDNRVAYIVSDILKDVIHHGTAYTSLSNSKSPLLARTDIAGKTGTTNDPRDAWFSGYQTEIVASAWVGFDDHAKALGKLEYGGRAALPMWQYFMESALAPISVAADIPPPGVVTAKIDPETGLLAASGSQKSIAEVFLAEHAPTETSTTTEETPPTPSENGEAPIVGNDDDGLF